MLCFSCCCCWSDWVRSLRIQLILLYAETRSCFCVSSKRTFSGSWHNLNARVRFNFPDGFLYAFIFAFSIASEVVLGAVENDFFLLSLSFALFLISPGDLKHKWSQTEKHLVLFLLLLLFRFLNRSERFPFYSKFFF